MEAYTRTQYKVKIKLVRQMLMRGFHRVRFVTWMFIRYVHFTLIDRIVVYCSILARNFALFFATSITWEVLCTDNPISKDLDLTLFRFVSASRSHIVTAIGYTCYSSRSLLSSIAYVNDFVPTAVSTFTAMLSQSVNAYYIIFCLIRKTYKDK